MRQQEIEEKLCKEHDVLARVKCSILGCDGLRFYTTKRLNVGDIILAGSSIDINGVAFRVGDPIASCSKCGKKTMLSIGKVEYLKGDL